MELDENVCLCFDVTRRKLENYLRVSQPSRASQLSQCGGAGTGCGWCVPILKKMFAHYQDDNSRDLDLPTSSQHSTDRQRYLRDQQS